MTDRLNYLKKCIVNKKQLEQKNWYLYCFNIPVLKQEAITNQKRYDIVLQPSGIHYLDLDETNSLVPVAITDSKPNTPLFSFQEVIKIDSTWLPTVTSSIETKIGNLVINTFVLYETVGTKIPYLNSSIKPSDIEKLLASKVKNEEVLTEKDISVPEMIKCIDRMVFLSFLGTYINVATTPKTITPPPGIREFKQKLLKEYEGQLNDPVKIVEFEQKLQNVDKEYLKDDPDAVRMSSKKAAISRKKTYLMVGETSDFVTSPERTVITSSYDEGVETDKQTFPMYMNDLRSGSFDRGSSTALSGYSYKILQRSLSGLEILSTPCNTTKGLEREITKGNYKRLVNRYVYDSKWKLLSSHTETEAYIGKTVKVRSPMFCTSPKNTLCYACVSEDYKHISSGVTNIAANLSSVLMNIFLKRMHGTILESTSIETKDLIS